MKKQRRTIPALLCLMNPLHVNFPSKAIFLNLGLQNLTSQGYCTYYGIGTSIITSHIKRQFSG